MKLLRPLDDLLNGITMYRLMVYGLSVLAAVSVLFGLTGRLSFSPVVQLLSLAVLLVAAYASNWALSTLRGAATNAESWLITGLILYFIMPPATSGHTAALLALTALLAMASKYLLALRRKHIFNPAAIAAAIMGLSGLLPATWWVGSAVLLPFTVLLGLVVLRKLRRFGLFTAFAAEGLVVGMIVSLLHNAPLPQFLAGAFLSGPLIFMGSIMLTEPSTLPPQRVQQLIYGAIVGALAYSHLRVGIVGTSPENALLIGNLLVFLFARNYRVKLRFKEKRELAPHIYEFVFTPERPIAYRAGQYMEWTLPHPHADDRGNRRSFTVASSPTEPDVRIGVKFYDPSSTFKQALLQLTPGAHVMAGQIAGDFVLPSEPAPKLVFIAGGIGVTPFRSMLKYLLDTTTGPLDIVLFYAVNNAAEMAYSEILQLAQARGVRLVPVVATILAADVITQAVPDLAERRVYLSGPNVMVTAYKSLLARLGVARRNIATDYFSGY